MIGADLNTSPESNIISLDITNYDNVLNQFKVYKPDIVLHCAAYTNVDGCERDPDTAFRVNAYGTKCVACAAAEIGATLIVISTDFVFDGSLGRPYHEFDAPNPISHYGASKLAGELEALRHCPKTYIVRTSWLYGLYGNNFPFTIIKRAKEMGELSVVADQWGTPTRTVDLINAIIRIIRQPLYGVYHVSNRGETSWFEFAKKTLELAGIENVKMHPLTSDECAQKFNTPTKRPRYSVLRHYMLELNGGDDLYEWQDALKLFLEEAKAKGKI